MKMFKKEGYLQLKWKSGSGMMIQSRGSTADIMLALATGINDVIESTVPPEKRVECARKLAELLLEMMRTPVTKIDLGAMMKGGARHE